MNRLAIIFVTIVFFSCQSTKQNQEETATELHVNHESHQPSEPEKKKSKSPRTAAMAMVGNNHIHIDYSSPSVRGRQIFGGLVAFGEVWVTGAHKATNINFDKDVIIGGKKITKGKYGLFTIPGQTEWTIIINELWDMHLADHYDQQFDVVRVATEVKTLDPLVEALSFEALSKK